MIIMGFQGIGKSTLALNRDNTIDLDSSNFSVDGERARDWYIPYCKIAVSLSKQLNTVFVSTHEMVREYIAYMGKDELLAVCYPALKLKDEWIYKLARRFERTGLEKDEKAWLNAVDSYEENIMDLINLRSFIQIPIESMNYDLDELIGKYEI